MPTNTRRSARKPARSKVPAQFRANAASNTTATPEQITDVAGSQGGEPFTNPLLISKRQHEFICDLFAKRDLTKSESFASEIRGKTKEQIAEYVEELKDKLKFVPKPRASTIIDALKALPYKHDDVRPCSSAQKVPQVPAGRFALRYPADELNPIRFYKVKHGEDKTEQGGKNWKGAIFVERFVSDNTFPVKYRSAEYFRVLKEIAENPLAAAQLYGDESERCCICNRGLTRRISRKMRIGPVCLRKHGDVFGLDPEAYIEENRAALIADGFDPDETLPQDRAHQHILDHD